MKPTWAWFTVGEGWELRAGAETLASVWLRRVDGERLWSWSLAVHGHGWKCAGDGLWLADAAKAAAERALWADE